jgi:hypothetical protein
MQEDNVWHVMMMPVVVLNQVNISLRKHNRKNPASRAGIASIHHMIFHSGLDYL